MPLLLSVTLTKAILGLLGLGSVIIILIGGYSWMKDQEDEKKIEKAKSKIIAGIIALVIITLSLALTNSIIMKLIAGAK